MNKQKWHRSLFILVSLTVPVELLLAFVVVPLFSLLYMSFTNWNGYSADSQFIGLGNYATMLNNENLWLSLKNNAVYFLVHLVMIVFELLFAVMLTGKLRGAKFYKTMTFMPYIINGVAISYAFSYFFSPINGAFDEILKTIKLGMLSRNWLSNVNIVNFVLAAVSVWRYSGYHVVLFIAALQSISSDIMEAAEIDGANTWQVLRYIQVPSIILMIDYVLFDNIRGALQVFDIPFVLTSGGPGYASSTFTLYTIKTAFQFSNFGLASAMAIAIMLIIIAMYLIQSRLIHGVLLRDGGDKK